MKRKIYKALSNAALGTAELALTLARVIAGLHFGSAPLRRGSSKALILGNGPSLKDDMETVERVAASGAVDLWCVNFFGASPAYTRLKPTNYVIADPAHWEEDIPEQLRQEREHFLERVFQVTDWSVLFHVPYSAKGTEFVARLARSPHVTLRFFNQTTADCRLESLLFWLYRHELAMPLSQNVLIPAVFLTILSGYEKVAIVGADHSWHRDILVRNGVLMMREAHFYEEDTQLKPFYKNATETFSMAEIFRIWSKVFTQYDRLSGFARSMRVEVVNSSSISFIDSFKSMTLSQL